MEEIIAQALNQDPRAAYLQQLGKAIAILCEKEKDGYWFNSATPDVRSRFINDIHSKAMEVIKTIEK